MTSSLTITATTAPTPEPVSASINAPSSAGRTSGGGRSTRTPTCTRLRLPVALSAPANPIRTKLSCGWKPIRYGMASMSSPGSLIRIDGTSHEVMTEL